MARIKDQKKREKNLARRTQAPADPGRGLMTHKPGSQSGRK